MKGIWEMFQISEGKILKTSVEIDLEQNSSDELVTSQTQNKMLYEYKYGDDQAG